MNKYQRAAKTIINDLRKNKASYSEETIARALRVLEGLKIKMEEIAKPVAIPKATELLYILAGGKPQAFLDYARQVPDKAVNDLARNPQALQNVLRQLQSKLTITPESKDGIPHADLQSSNVYGYQYDPETGGLRFRFNSGAIYDYYDVPPSIYRLLSEGAIPAKTTGSNEYGTWWTGKKPSLGASASELLKNGPFNYRRVA